VIYVFDSNSFGVLKNFYPGVFAGFWEQFDSLVAQGRIVSVREVERELSRREDSQHLVDWVAENHAIFSGPTEPELERVREIFSVAHFQQLIGQKQLLKGYPVADPFIVARAGELEGCVVTEERFRPNAAKVPNVCDHFGIECTNVEGMLDREGWSW